MKVIVATSTSPFVFGGATLIVDWLEDALRERGHEVETYRIPVHANPEDLPAQLVGLRTWDFTGHGDRLITVRTPSYLIRHHSKVVWFLHHLRQVYDLYDRYPMVADDGDGREFRRMMFASDDVALGECHAVFANSQVMADRLRHFNGIDAEVLYPPLSPAHGITPGPLGDELVYVSRVVGHKRQLLAVQAMGLTTTDVRLVLAGPNGGDDASARITAEIARLGLQDRVTFIDNKVSDAKKNELLANALGVLYLPFDEDSYGFVGLEAVAAGKPLVTVSDSGGVLELVRDGVNGIVCDPEPASLAAAFDRLYRDRAFAGRLGAAQADEVDRLKISWDHVVERLLA